MTQLSLGKILFKWSFLSFICFCYLKHLISFFDGEGTDHLVDLLWSWFLGRVRVLEWIVVPWDKHLIVGMWSKGAIVVSLIKGTVVGISIILWFGTVARDMPGLFAIEAESFLQVLASFFIAHRVDGCGDDIDVHGIQIISGLIIPLVVSLLVCWS